MIERPYGPIKMPAARYPRTGLPGIADQKTISETRSYKFPISFWKTTS